MWITQQNIRVSRFVARTGTGLVSCPRSGGLHGRAGHAADVALALALIGGGSPALPLALLIAAPKLGGIFNDGVLRCVGCVGDVGEACVGDCGDIPGSDVGTEGSVRRFELEESDDALLSTASPAPASARLRSAMLPPLAVDTDSSLLRLLHKSDM